MIERWIGNLVPSDTKFHVKNAEAVKIRTPAVGSFPWQFSLTRIPASVALDWSLCRRTQLRYCLREQKLDINAKVIH